MTGITCALVGSGGSLYSGAATVTVGYYNGGSFDVYGFNSGVMGSISPTTWASTGLPFHYVSWWNNPSAYTLISFAVTGTAPNSDWETININGTPFSRSAASYSVSGGRTTWDWLGGIGAIPNPFGTVVGATKAVVWS